MTLLTIYFTLSVTISFLCSLLESVILSTSHAYVAVNAKKDRPSGLILKEFRGNIDRPLAAILTLNTIANTLGAAGVGAQVLHLYGDKYVALVSSILTLTILIFSEIIPKTLGASHWKTLAPFCAHTTRVLIVVTYPFVFLLEFLSQYLKKDSKTQITREEMIETAEMGATDGTLRRKESLIIKNLLMLSNVYVHDIMTPRSVVTAFSSNSTVKEVMSLYQPIRYSRIPVYEGSLDNILGVVHRYKILENSSRDNHDVSMKELMTPVHSIPEDVPVSASLDQFIQRQEHVFIVVDDYGSTIGIVTLEDAIETLLGVEIVDEFDSVADLRQHALEQWQNRKKQRVEPTK